MPPRNRTRSTTAAALNADVEALIAVKDNTKLAPAKAMFESVIRILGIAEDEMIEDQAFVELAQRCSEMRHVLETTTEEMDFGGLSELLGETLGNLEKALRHIESKITDMIPGAHYPQEPRSGTTQVPPALWEVELRNVLEIIGDILIECGSEKRRQPLDSGEKALQELISGKITHDQPSSLIEAVFSSKNAIKTIGLLEERDAQALIDVVDQVLKSSDIAPNVQTNCLKPLYRTCAGRGLLPRSLQIELVGGLTGDTMYRGGFGDVRRCEYQGQQVAVKVLRMCARDDMRKTTWRFCKEFITWKALQHPKILPLLGAVMSGSQFAMVSKWMPNGNINEFLEDRRDVNRFALLEDVAEGLAYMHEQEMVHGDLKGANIVIDENCRACLADFGLLRIISNTTNLALSSSSFTQGGSYRWMSPELLYPKEFGLGDGYPTKPSDCYALGMVFYEVLTGNMPFYPLSWQPEICLMVLRGRRPDRPQGTEGSWVTDDVWRVLEHCWKPERDDRPSIASVLRWLQEWAPPSPRSLALACPPSSISDRSTERSMGEDQTPSLAPSRSSRALLPQVLRHKVSDNRDPETDGKDPKEVAEVQDRPPPATGRIWEPLVSQGVSRRRHGGTPQPTADRRTSAANQSAVFNVGSTDNTRRKVDDRALEPHDLSAPVGSIKNAFPGAPGAREGRQHPGASHTLGTLVRITCGWIASGTPLITFFF